MKKNNYLRKHKLSRHFPITRHDAYCAQCVLSDGDYTPTKVDCYDIIRDLQYFTSHKNIEIDWRSAELHGYFIALHKAYLEYQKSTRIR